MTAAPAKHQLLFPTLAALKAAVAEARAESFEAATEATDDWYKIVSSRGVSIVTGNGSCSCDPSPGGEATEWDRTLSSIHQMIDLVLAKYPEVTEISLDGGHDVHHMVGNTDGDSIPLAGDWGVVVWTR